MTQPQLMRGFERLRQIVSSYLQVAMPYYIDAARAEWSLDEFMLPYPVKYNVYDPDLVAEWPFIGMVVANDSNHVRNDVLPDGSQEYQHTLSTRLILVARTPLLEDGSTWAQPEKDQATRLCTDLTRCMHNALLQGPGCGRPREVFFEETTMTTDYLDPMRPGTQGDRWVAMSVTNADFRLTEKTFALPYGVANTISTEVAKLTP